MLRAGLVAAGLMGTGVGTRYQAHPWGDVLAEIGRPMTAFTGLYLRCLRDGYRLQRLRIAALSVTLGLLYFVPVRLGISAPLSPHGTTAATTW